MQTILVTGAAGFIGHHLVLNLVKEGYQVIGLDNLNNYYDVRLKYARLKEQGVDKNWFMDNEMVQSSIYENYSFIKLDLVDKSNLTNLFRIKRFDYVVNLAAQAGVRYSLINPDVYIQSNIVGFTNLLQACNEIEVKHLIYASSSSVYGLNKKVPFSVKDNVDFPISLYAATKKSNELMAHVYSHIYNLPTTGIRFFTVYGPWGRPDMAYFLFTRSILEGKTIKVFNNGNLSRDFTYVSDIVAGIRAVLPKPPKMSSSELTNSNAPYRIYNIGNNSPVNLLKFIECIEKELGMPAKKELVEMQPGDVDTTYADVSELVHEFDYAPGTNLEKGIAEFVKWYKSFYNIVTVGSRITE